MWACFLRHVGNVSKYDVVSKNILLQYTRSIIQKENTRRHKSVATRDPTKNLLWGVRAYLKACLFRVALLLATDAG